MHLLLCLFLISASDAAAQPAVVGSKAFTEGFILAELAAQTLERANTKVDRRFGLGSTAIVSQAIRKGEIDLYPDYTGTIRETLFPRESFADHAALARRLKDLKLVMSKPLGFQNLYHLAVSKTFADRFQLRTISDLKRVEKIVRSVISYEFHSRSDGLRPLLKFYGLELPNDLEPIEHTLAYEAISSGRADLIDVYTTDAQIDRLDLVVLEDDRKYFANYEAVFLAREDFVEDHPEGWAAINALGNTITTEKMRDLNGAVEIDKKTFFEVVQSYLNGGSLQPPAIDENLIWQIWHRTKEHASLVGITVFISVLTGVPLGILASRRERLGQVLLLISALVQTIPSLALLCLLIPIFGIGTKPALIALYLYSLLPILLNTYIGLRSIEDRLVETAFALGLNPVQRIFWIELPLASRSILGGIKTATIIGIGTATLAALIGAGGYGAPIVTGLAVNDMRTILTGAIPAAAMSLAVYLLFEVLDRTVIPKGLR